jgi:hypothetical protein
MRCKHSTYIPESLPDYANGYNLLPSCFRYADLQASVCDQSGSSSSPWLVYLGRFFWALAVGPSYHATLSIYPVSPAYKRRVGEHLQPKNRNTQARQFVRRG